MKLPLTTVAASLRHKPVVPPLRWTRPDTTGWTVIEIGGTTWNIPDGSWTNQDWDHASVPDYILLPGGNYVIKQVGPINKRIRLNAQDAINLAWIGGEINIDTPWVYPGFDEDDGGYYIFRTAMELSGDFRIVYFEGLHLHGRWCVETLDLWDGSSVNLTLQNCRFIISTEQVPDKSQSDGFRHADCVQATSGLTSFNVANSTFQTTHQVGMYGGGDVRMDRRWKQMKHYRVNWRYSKYTSSLSSDSSRILSIISSPAIEGPLQLTDAYIDPYPRLWGGTADVGDRACFWSGASQYVESVGRTGWIANASSNYPTRGIFDETGAGHGYFWRGAPPHGDFCPEGVAGIDYVAPPNVIAEPLVNVGIDNYAHDDNRPVKRTAAEQLGSAVALSRKWFIENSYKSYTPDEISGIDNIMPAGDSSNFGAGISNWRKIFTNRYPDFGFDLGWATDAENGNIGVMHYTVTGEDNDWYIGAIHCAPDDTELRIPVTPGNQLYVEAYVRQNSETLNPTTLINNGASMFIVWVDAAGSMINYSMDAAIFRIRVARYVAPYYQIEVPTGAAYAVVGVGISKPLAGAEYFISRVYAMQYEPVSDDAGTELSDTQQLNWRPPENKDYRIRYECETDQGMAYDDVIIRAIPHTANWMQGGVEFDDGVGNWVLTTSGTLDTVQDDDGTFALRATAAIDGGLDAANGFTNTGDLPNVEGGDEIYVAFDLKQVQGSGPVQVGINVDSISGGSIIETSWDSVYLDVSTLGYIRHARTVTIAPGATAARMHVSFSSATTKAGAQFLIKNPYMGDVPPPDKNKLSQQARSFGAGLNTWVNLIAPAGFSKAASSVDGGVMVLSASAAADSIGVSHTWVGDTTMVPVTPGSVVYGAFQVKRAAGDSGRARVRFIWADSDGAWLTIAEPPPVNDVAIPDDAYATAWFQATAPQGAAYAVLGVIIINPPAGSSYYIDNCWLGDPPDEWIPPVPEFDANRLPRGDARDFLTSKARWMSYLWPAGASVEWSESFGGTLRLDSPPGPNRVAICHTWRQDTDSVVSVVPGEPLYAYLDVLRMSGADIGVQLAMIWTDGAFVELSAPEWSRTEGPLAFLSNGPSVTRLQMMALVPAAAAYARLVFIANGSSGATYYLDNAHLGDPKD
ncbi:hypothetical protein [Pigmentiphaga sp. CHJ604]|uniref:hypothetical protein n=1 Tax=Pigmentiphaga sp. CHJ604 TaxID=3081984 RepID=UPI0030CC7596